jgi:hypothetical protein
MPWMFALFLTMVWLVPFDRIILEVPSPIDLTFDRLVLPVVIAVWALALLMGGSVAPRLRWTPIHVAVAAFVTCAFASVLLNAAALDRTLELDAALKRLPLLVTYIFVFVIPSSSVRSREVRAFFTYTLALAVIVALGVLWEYRFRQNLFYEWSDKLLPGVFEIGKVDPSGVDELGRRLIQGPAAVPLETVAMLTMALPIPLVRLTQARAVRERLVYGLAACLLFAPVALALVVMVPVLAPGAIATTTAQFEPSRLGATTVSDRTADYDAIRPDVWTHLLFGRGWGTYSHVSYRILDSEILQRLIETGVVGLLAYLLVIGSVFWTARATIAERDRTWAPLALSGAASAVAFGVVSTLYDVMSFSHGVYIFLCIAGLVAVVVSRDRGERDEELAAEEPRLRERRQRPPLASAVSPRDDAG